MLSVEAGKHFLVDKGQRLLSSVLLADPSEKSFVMKNLNHLATVCLASLFGVFSPQAQEEWVGDPNTLTYRISGSAWVDTHITIHENQKVIIEPGTTIYLGASGSIDIRGQITALGSPEQPIEFVRLGDDTRWGAVVLRSSDAPSQFSHCLFSGGGGSINFNYAMLALYGASAEFSQCTFTGSRGPGIYIANCDPEINLCDFINNQGPAILMTPNADPLHHLNTAEGNGINAISVGGGEVDREITFDADGLPYHLNNSLSLTANAKLTISPGCRLELGPSGYILALAGSIQALGTPEQPIEFVRHEDEARWGAVVLRSSEASGQFSHCLFSGGGGSINYNYAMLYIDGGIAEFTQSTFKGSSGPGMFIRNSAPEIVWCQFESNAKAAILMTPNADPSHHHNTAEDNGINAISITGGDVKKDITFDADGLPYHLNNSLSLTGNAKLTMSPGCRLVLGPSGYILAFDGSIQAIGTPKQPIEFVRHKDETRWGAVVLKSSELYSQLSHCLFAGGGGSINYDYTMLYIDGGAAIINGCVFRDSYRSGVKVQSSAGEMGVAITNSLFSGNEYGVYANASSGPLMAVYYSAFSGNKRYGIYNGTKQVVDASMGNFWDDPTGPLDELDTDGLGLINQANADQEGRQKVSEYVMWNNQAKSPPEGWDNESDPDQWIGNLSPFGQQYFSLGCAVLNEPNLFSVRIPILRNVKIFDLEPSSSDMTVRNNPLGSYQEGDTLLIELLLEPHEKGNYFNLISINTGLQNLPQLIQISAQVAPSAEECAVTPVRITFDSADEITPSWHPSKNQIIYASNRSPSNTPDVWNIGLVEAQGNNERLIITGANSRFGVAHHPTWSGDGEEILTEERVGLHEYIEITWNELESAVDISQTDFRSLAVINGGGGGGMFALSRDKSTFLWRFGSRYGQENISIRSASFGEVNGEPADSFGFVHIALQARHPDFIHHMGGSINSDGSWFVLPEPSGDGVDLFMRQIDGLAVPIQLTSSGLKSGAINRSPEISPDDSSIAFIHETGETKQVDLAFYDIAQEIEVILTNDSLREADPSWSPDGTQLVFSRYDTSESSDLRFGENPNHNLYTISLSPAVNPDPGQIENVPIAIHRAIELEFTVEETRDYVLQHSNDLTIWQDYQFITNQNPGPMSIFVRQSKEARFWRLLYQAP